MSDKPSGVTDPDLAARLEEFRNLPIIHEDDWEVDMGQADLHTLCEHDLRYGMAAHLAGQPQYRVLSNLNLHYQPRFPRAFLTPDLMVITPTVPLPVNLTAYYIEKTGPLPVLVGEILSERTAEERDLEEKPSIYSLIGVPEYLLVDLTADYLPQRLLLKRLQPNRTWKDEQDADGGVTSSLGFRVVIEPDGRLRVVDAATGKRYVRPDEAARRIAELEAELARLRGKKPRK
jgi:hypothetical protein